MNDVVAWRITHNEDRKTSVTAVCVGGVYPDPQARAEYCRDRYGAEITALVPLDELRRLKASIGAIHFHANRPQPDAAVMQSIAWECEAAVPELRALRKSPAEETENTAA